METERGASLNYQFFHNLGQGEGGLVGKTLNFIEKINLHDTVGCLIDLTMG